MRWLYHVATARDAAPFLAGEVGALAPASLAAEGFLHASYQDKVEESARLYFPAGEPLVVHQIDPRRILDLRVEVAATPRGPMPHVHAAVPRDAVRRTLSVDEVAHAPDRVTGTRFVFVTFGGMTLLDLVGVLDPVSRLASMTFDPTSTSRIVTLDATTPWASAGAALIVEHVRPSLEDSDVLVVVGGPPTRTLVEDPEVAAWLASFPHNRLVTSVCTGALLLGAAGRLRGRRATTHHVALDLLARWGATAVRERVVTDGNVMTAGGVTSGLDLGVAIVRRLEGDDVADAIARQMELRAD
ncbi:MAG: ThiJ/PfpI domain protein [Myxococcaceae bacterium]|nr:ThiJ/PfpI domain protein [Myxococcaceae bacterium]